MFACTSKAVRMLQTSSAYFAFVFLNRFTLCDCFATTELLAMIAPPLKGSRFHDTITKAAVCKLQYDWLARKGNINDVQSPNPLEYKACPYGHWTGKLGRTFLLAHLALLDFATNSFEPDRDPATKKDPTYHFDGDLMIQQTNDRLIAARNATVDALIAPAPNYYGIRVQIASSLHTIQDFYSHTNWIEMNKAKPNPNIAINSDLGIQIAPPDMATCSDCSRASLTAEQLKQANNWKNSPTNIIFNLLGWSYDPSNVYICRGNLVNIRYLTSGYASSEESVASKIASPMKCSHGGGGDSSSKMTATGGINKDTNTFLYSPHYHLHFRAANVAVQASIDYLESIRTAINDEYKFGCLLGMQLCNIGF